MRVFYWVSGMNNRADILEAIWDGFTICYDYKCPFIQLIVVRCVYDHSGAGPTAEYHTSVLEQLEDSGAIRNLKGNVMADLMCGDCVLHCELAFVIVVGP